MKFEKMVIIVTGGAGGIGFASARGFLKGGAKVALWDRDPVALKAALDALEYPEDRVRAYELSVNNPQQVEEIFAKVEEDLGEVDVILCNAGITRDAMLHKMEERQFDEVLDTNLKGVFLCGQAAAKRMRERGRGVILSTSSIVGIHGNIGQTNYAASKAGVIAMTKTWARELGPKGVRANAVAPGFVETEMINTVPQKVKDLVCSQTSLGRMGKPEEIANAFLFLASPEASFITGQVLCVDGGLTL
ncbi:beta-ketoacyl-ACP reductase [bacterium]|jgi:3-oxoacyl-[acyl-carrier protein] reductase|nr:beta-ketoacyl-ACP reductase [bacterium]